MSQYRNSPDGFAALRKRLIKISLAFDAIVVLFTLIVMFSSEKGSDRPVDFSVWLLVIAIVLAILIYAMIGTIKRQKVIYYSYVLTIENNHLSRQQNGISTLTLDFNKITQIIKSKNGSLLIKGQKTGDYICVSSNIEDYEQVINSLQSILPISDYVAKNVLQKYPYVLPVLTIVLMATVYLADNKIVVLPSGIVLIILLGWSFYNTLINKQLDSRTKRVLWYLPPILLAILAIVYYKVFVK